MDTKKLNTFVLDNVGANFPKRDAVDARVIKTVQTGKAIYAKDATGVCLSLREETVTG